MVTLSTSYTIPKVGRSKDHAASDHGATLGGHNLEGLPPQALRGPASRRLERIRSRVVANLRRAGYAKAFSLTTRTNHAPVEARLGEVSTPTLVVMGEQDPDFKDQRAEADWIAHTMHGEVLMVPEAGHYPSPSVQTSRRRRYCDSSRRWKSMTSLGVRHRCPRRFQQGEPRKVTALSSTSRDPTSEPTGSAIQPSWRSDGTVIGAPRIWLRLEGAALIVAALVVYSTTHEGWWLVPVTVLSSGFSGAWLPRRNAHGGALLQPGACHTVARDYGRRGVVASAAPCVGTRPGMACPYRDGPSARLRPEVPRHRAPFTWGGAEEG